MGEVFLSKAMGGGGQPLLKTGGQDHEERSDMGII
jgi:hypothetical protein